jgi:hypothetical protein
MEPKARQRHYKKSINFWDITPCSPLSVNRRFGGTYRLHLQGRTNNFSKQAGGKQNHKSFSLDSVSSQIFSPFPKTNFNIFFHLYYGFPNCLFPSNFLTKISYPLLASLVLFSWVVVVIAVVVVVVAIAQTGGVVKWLTMGNSQQW